MTGRWRNFNQPHALPIFDCGQVSLVLDNVLFESVSLTPNPFPTSLQFTIENNNEGFLPGPRCFYDTNLPLDSELRPMLPFASEEAWNKFILPEFFFPNVVPPANRTDSPSRGPQCLIGANVQTRLNFRLERDRLQNYCRVLSHLALKMLLLMVYRAIQDLFFA